ncbi:MAG: hypothetical protein WCY05_07350 [Candidatus Omnitrophota bacterium]
MISRKLFDQEATEDAQLYQMESGLNKSIEVAEELLIANEGTYS